MRTHASSSKCSMESCRYVPSSEIYTSNIRLFTDFVMAIGAYLEILATLERELEQHTF